MTPEQFHWVRDYLPSYRIRIISQSLSLAGEPITLPIRFTPRQMYGLQTRPVADIGQLYTFTDLLPDQDQSLKLTTKTIMVSIAAGAIYLCVVMLAIFLSGVPTEAPTISASQSSETNGARVSQ